jgi:putative transposase
MPKRDITFEKGNYYHLYNRGVNKEMIFFSDRNYSFFVILLSRYLQRTDDIVAYCLMPNHFHLLIFVKSDQIISQSLHPLLVTYVKSINNQEKRVGPLFQGRFNANPIEDDEYLLDCVKYIHLNPVKANLVSLPLQWNYSSYADYLNTSRNTFIETSSVLRFFESTQAFRDFTEIGIESYESRFFPNDG